MSIRARAAAGAFVTLAVLLAVSSAAVQPTAPGPVQPGAVQPVAPGTLLAGRLPSLKLVPPLPQARSVEYAGNGRIEVAHALLLVAKPDLTRPRLLALAQAAVARAFAARPSLSEVDVSEFEASGYAGPGGPLPAFTASVPVARQAAFLVLKPANMDDFDRLWVNAAPDPAIKDLTPSGDLEVDAKPSGTTAELTAIQALKLNAEIRGGSAGGMILHGDRKGKVIALTFDDAPHPMYEPLLLDDLRAAGAHATFFVVGRNARAYPYFLRDMIAGGHEVANHTYHHVRLNTLSQAATTEELSLANQVITSITGRAARYFRPPGGRYTPVTLRAATALGLTTAFWTDDPADYTNRPGETIETKLQRLLRPGGIILLHDNVLNTIQELPDFLKDEAKAGLRLETLATLAGF